jgi:predicted transcriptional regulator
MAKAKLTEGQLDCLRQGKRKGYIYEMDHAWTGETYRTITYYIEKLLKLGLIKEKKYGFYELTEKANEYITP